MFKDIITAVAVPVTAFIAISGLNTWQRQMKGTADFELMRNVLRAVYKVRDAINDVRSPFSMLVEGDHVINESVNNHLTPADKTIYTLWQRVTDSISELDIVKNEAEVVWGATAKQKLLLLEKPYIKIASALPIHRNLLMNRTYNKQDEKTIAELSKIVCKHNSDGNSDDFDCELNSVVEEIEDYARSKVK